MISWNEARVIQVIETTLLRRGLGLHVDDPVRIIRQYWSLDGQLLAEVDPVLEEQRQALKVQP